MAMEAANTVETNSPTGVPKRDPDTWSSKRTNAVTQVR